jgi:hypothetical protein
MAFEVRNPQIESDLKKIGKTIADVLPDGWGFTLFIFSFGEDGNTFYLSNAKREDMLKALVEFIMRQQEEGEQRGGTR